ncbi:MAG: DUF6702 family protein [Bacteroidia bacterium]
MNKFFDNIKIVPAVKLLFVCAFTWLVFSSFHPFYVSTTEMNFNSKSKSVEITCRMFTDNLEDALEKSYNKQVDILHPKDKREIELLLLQYIQSNLKIKINGEFKRFDIIGYEKEEDAIWTYLEIKEEIKPKTLEIENTLLYKYYSQQISMMHVMVDGENRQSGKVTNPDKKLNFTY